MESSRWQQIDALFRRGLLVPSDEREDWLREVCSGDADLRGALTRLLKHDAAGRDVLADTVRASAREVAAIGRLSLEGRQLGPWSVQERLGSGGMSVVYRAFRSDQQFDKEVALKLLKPGLDTEDVLRRFQTERRILAALEHPNVCRILDAGTTEEGRPFFVMESVDGEPIDAYCDRHRLTVEERIQLFLQVLDAVAAAHRNLVIHRDVKPSNILVTREGTPKLLDFGIAKVLTPDLYAGGETTAPTRRPMTLSYASPEHMAGRNMTTASDVYSLGVVLYELLAGTRPYATQGLSAEEMEARLQASPPPLPSKALERGAGERRVVEGGDEEGHPSGGTVGGHRVEVASVEEVARCRRSSARQLCRRLAGDLDVVTLKALRFEPDRRYPSTELFAADLRRFLDGWPVEARADSLRYRFSKFVGRHRLGVASAVVVGILILASVTALTVSSFRLAREKQASEQERGAAEQVSGFVIDMFHAVTEDSPPEQVRRAERILDAESARVSRELAAQPRQQATMLHALGRISLGLGLHDRARPLMEEALALRRELLGDEHAAVLGSLDDLAILSAERGDYARAEALFRQSLVLRQQIHAPPHTALSSNLNNLALSLHDQGKYLQAEPLYREALAMDSEVLGRQHLRTAPGLLNLGLLLYDLGSFEEARGLLEEAVEVYRLHEGTRSLNLAETLRILGAILSALNEEPLAASTLEESISLFQTLAGPRHPHLARARYSLATHYQRQGRWQEALALHRLALDQRLEVLGAGHPEVATSRAGLGETLAALGHLEEAEASFVRALEIHRDTLPPGHSELGTTLTRLARLRTAQGGQAAEVWPLAQEAWDILRAALRPGDPRIEAARALVESPTRPVLPTGAAVDD